MIDTGAARTVIAPLRAHVLEQKLGVTLTTLRRGGEATGVGGSWPTRAIDATVELGAVELPLLLTIMEPRSIQPIALAAGPRHPPPLCPRDEPRCGRDLVA